MAVSAITGVTIEEPHSIASFLRLGVVYVIWSVDVSDVGIKKLRWKAHTANDFTETTSSLAFKYNNVSAIYIPASDSILVAWDDGLAVPDQSNGGVYTALFNPVTGALLSGPTLIGQGSVPKLSYRLSTPGNEIVMYTVFKKTNSIYGRMSTNGGISWQSAVPVLTNQVLDTEYVKVIRYDDDHVSVAQLGEDPRRLSEIGMLKRTRPVVSIVRHPTLSNKYFISEPSRRDFTSLTDTLRGSLVVDRAGTALYHLDGTVAGSSDSIGAVALLTYNADSLTVDASAGPGVSDGDDFSKYTLAPSLISTTELPGTTGIAVSMDVTNDYAYIAEYTETSATGGALIVLRLSDQATSVFLSNVSGRAIGVGTFGSTFKIFAATTESGVENLRLYNENDLTPTLVATYTLPARVNAIKVVLDSATTGDVYVSMVDRLNKYRYVEGLPLRLIDSFSFSGGGQFFRAQLATNGNLVVAAGTAGVVVFTQTGRVKAQVLIGPLNVSEWKPVTNYTLNTLVKPRASHIFAASRFYFKNTTAGVSGSGEPAWASTGTIVDGTAQWQPVAVTDSVVTDLVLDEATKRILAVGVLGGNAGTDGRVWVINAQGLI
jgi:hypothetical protein